jgi:glycine/D-amino acid oxidase-like deaminating enzyme/nitrite reductase/ring-hydroxylating ferredoxin subunit
MIELRNSLWQKNSSNSPALPHLQKDIKVDIAIIGGGITGLSLANILKDKGLKVCLLERHQLFEGVSAQTSAHLSTHWDQGYYNIKKHHSLETAAAIYKAMQDAIRYIEIQSTSFTKDVNFKYVDGYLYRENETQADEIQHEKIMCKELGIDVEDMPKYILPFTIKEGIKISKQAIFQPVHYLSALTKSLASYENLEIYENSPVVDFNGTTLITPHAKVEAQHVVHATHTPVGFHLPQAIMDTFRSYLVAGPYNGNLPEALFWDSADPYHYIRTFEEDGTKYLVIGGEDENTGNEKEAEAFHRIESYARDKFGLKEITRKWSAQLFEAADMLPIIGKSPNHNHHWVATGFSGDGLTMGTASAMILSEMILNNSHPLEKTFSPMRLPLNKDFFVKTASVVGHLVKDRFHVDDVKPESLQPGEGCVHASLTDPKSYYRNLKGEVYEMSAVCPHMKCVVHWNSEQKTFDCPCHGSRFTTEGEVIEGPALVDLANRRLYKGSE